MNRNIVFLSLVIFVSLTACNKTDIGFQDNLSKTEISEGNQTATIGAYGRVTACYNGSVLPNTAVSVKGRAWHGTMTDHQGNYLLDLPLPSDTILVFSHLGYKTQEVKVPTSIAYALINVCMAPDSD